jgi:hypothetical protein
MASILATILEVLLIGENRGVDGDDNGLLRGVCDILPNVIAQQAQYEYFQYFFFTTAQYESLN